MCSKDEISNGLTCLSQPLKCYGTGFVEFDLQWYLEVLWLDSPFFVLVRKSLFMWSERVSCLLWSQSGASWECLCLLRLTFCLMTENCSDDSSSLSNKTSFLLRNDIVEVEQQSLIRLFFPSAGSFNRCLLFLLLFLKTLFFIYYAIIYYILIDNKLQKILIP